MDEETKLPEEKPKKKDPRQSRSPSGAFGFRMAAILLVLYMLYQVVRDYIQGGADAPSLGLLILAIVVLGGGSVVIGILSYRQWKDSMKQEDAPEEHEASDGSSD